MDFDLKKLIKEASADVQNKNMDPSLMKVEVWNPYKVDLHFEMRIASMEYLKRNGRQTHLTKFTLKPGQMKILSHQYWDVSTRGGLKNADIFLPMNLGRDIGHGIKWMPTARDKDFDRWEKILTTVNAHG